MISSAFCPVIRRHAATDACRRWPEAEQYTMPDHAFAAPAHAMPTSFLFPFTDFFRWPVQATYRGSVRCGAFAFSSGDVDLSIDIGDALLRCGAKTDKPRVLWFGKAKRYHFLLVPRRACKPGVVFEDETRPQHLPAMPRADRNGEKLLLWAGGGGGLAAHLSLRAGASAFLLPGALQHRAGREEEIGSSTAFLDPAGYKIFFLRA